MLSRFALLWAPVALLLGACQIVPERHVPVERLRLPPGFKAEVWALVPGARSLRVTDGGGKVYVGTQGHEVFAVLDAERDGRADEVVPVASGLSAPNGVAVDRQGALIIAEQHRIIRITNSGRIRDVVPPGVFPDADEHAGRYAALGPDGRLYVGVGAPCNVCTVSNFAGTIVRMLPDGHELEIFARGVRNAVGFDWHPQTGEMFFIDRGAELPDGLALPDQLNHVPEPGLHFGFPCRYGPRKAYPGFAYRLPPAPVVHPVLELEAQAAAVGLQFYEGAMFPASYRHDALIAEHGSSDRAGPVGYRITRVRFVDGRPVGREVFIRGWLGENGVPWGRPVDLEMLPDGSLLISDDHAGAIYRITYAPGSRPR